MRKSTLTAILSLFMILISLNGCTDFFSDVGTEDKVIPVGVYLSATVNNASGQPVSGVELQFDLSKTNGQDFRAYRTTNEQGIATVNQYSYNLHKGQVITARCTVTNHLMIDEKTVHYTTLLPDMETYATTTWYEYFEFTLDR